jgi:hypothetical protein
VTLLYETVKNRLLKIAGYISVTSITKLWNCFCDSLTGGDDWGAGVVSFSLSVSDSVGTVGSASSPSKHKKAIFTSGRIFQIVEVLCAAVKKTCDSKWSISLAAQLYVC